MRWAASQVRPTASTYRLTAAYCLPLTAYYQDQLRSDFDVDRARLGFLAIRQLHREHAVLVVSTHLRCVHSVGQSERSRERAIATLDAAELLFRHVGRKTLVPLEGQRVVLD